MRPSRIHQSRVAQATGNATDKMNDYRCTSERSPSQGRAPRRSLARCGSDDDHTSVVRTIAHPETARTPSPIRKSVLPLPDMCVPRVLRMIGLSRL